MNRRRLRRALSRKQDASGKRPFSTSFSAGPCHRKDGNGRTQEEFALLASYSEALSAHAIHLEQIKGSMDVSAVEGFVGCAAIVSAILKTCWRDEGRALDLAARAVLLSRSFLTEFLDASGGIMSGNEQLRVARSMHGMGSLCPPPGSLA